ncbi:hypothetical protein Q7P37_002393 [Cladosporium fusiforme]
MPEAQQPPGCFVGFGQDSQVYTSKSPIALIAGALAAENAIERGSNGGGSAMSGGGVGGGDGGGGGGGGGAPTPYFWPKVTGRIVRRLLLEPIMTTALAGVDCVLWARAIHGRLLFYVIASFPGQSFGRVVVNTDGVDAEPPCISDASELVLTQAIHDRIGLVERFECGAFRILGHPGWFMAHYGILDGKVSWVFKFTVTCMSAELKASIAEETAQ